MAAQSPFLTFSAGALVGGLVTYAAVTTVQSSTPARKAKKTVDTATDAGIGSRPARLKEHRDPITGPLPLPETKDDLRVLDRIICEVFRSEPDLADEPVLFATEVFTRVVGVEGPTVAGDHPSLVKLEGIIEFRIIQMSLDDESQTPRQNLNRLCPVTGGGETPGTVGG